MSGKINYFNLLVFILYFQIVASFKYPINNKLIDAELGDITSIEMTTKEDFDKFIMKNDYVISIFHADWCGHCKRFLPVFDEASRYKVINKNWKFVKVSCSKNEYLCNSFGINGYPTLKTFKESKEIKRRPPRELGAFLEYLLKISSNPIIEIDNNSIEQFYKDYGTFSPIINYNSKNMDFISCIKGLANKEFLTEYFFGLVKNDNEKNQKIIFNFDNNSITHTWGGNCDDVKTFLNNNLFPLVSDIDITFMRQMDKYQKTLFMIFYNSNNDLLNNFIKKEYQKISKDNRHLVFGFVNVNKNHDLTNYFKINLSKESEAQILIYDFAREISYKHPTAYDVNIINEEILENNIRELIKNMNKLPFTSGSKFKDFFRKIGLADLSSTTTIILIVIIFGVLLSILCYLLLCCESEDNYEDLDAGDEKILKKIMKEKKEEKKNINKEQDEKKIKKD